MSAAELVSSTVLAATREERELYVVAERTPWGVNTTPDRTLVEGPVAAFRFDTWRDDEGVWTNRTPVGTFTSTGGGDWSRTTYESLEAAEHECRVAAALRAEVTS